MKLKDFDFRIWDNTEKRYLNEIELHKYDKSPRSRNHIYWNWQN